MPVSPTSLGITTLGKAGLSRSVQGKNPCSQGYRFWSSQILGTPEQAEQWLREFTEGNFYIGGAVNPRNADMIAEDVGNDIIFNGDKFFSTGM